MLKRKDFIRRLYFYLLILLIIGCVVITNLNLARFADASSLEEECKAYKDKAGKNLQKVDLNKATEEELEALPGIGVKTARAIVDHRKTIGRFKSMEQLLRVRGVGDKVYKCLSDIATIGN